LKVLVIGSGIIGLATGYQLARRGCEVVVAGDRAPGAGASVNNAGWVVPAESGPLPAPGLVLQALRWMTRPDSPVYVRPSLRPAFVRFMVAMARACNPAAYWAAFEATASLGRGTMAELDRWAADGLVFEMHRLGEVRAYVEPAELRRAAADIGRYARAGIAATLLGGDEARAAVPELSAAVVGGIRFPEERHVHPASLVAALVDRLRALGVTFVDGAVTRGAVRPGGGFEVGGAFGEVAADAVVIAAGAWSGGVAARFGARLPVRPGKGYSVDFVPPPSTLRVPVMLAEAHCVLTPLDGALRVAGTMEFGGFDEHVSPARLAAIRRAPSRYLDSWDPDAPARPATAGLRPVTPDGLPVIGPLRASPGLYVATGHAMLGLTLAPRTGRLLAELILDGAQPAVLAPFSPRRFGA
jgi:D-amino-acid dehydrogenase